MTNLERISFIIPFLLITTDPPTVNASTQPQSSSDIRNTRHIFNTLIASENLVHLFDSQTFGFRNAEVNPDDEDDAESHEKVEGTKGNGFEHTGSNQSDDKLWRVSLAKRDNQDSIRAGGN